MGFSKIAVAVLAGGASRRMGSPKLLAPFVGGTLLERAAAAADGCAADVCAVVTGAYHREMIPVLARAGWEAVARDSVLADKVEVSGTVPSADCAAEGEAAGTPNAASGNGDGRAVGASQRFVVRNRQWESGQASSVRAAVRFARAQGCTALLLMVADQPYVTAAHLNALIAEYDQGRSDAYLASNDQGHGNPCLFDGALFNALASLEGDEGARALFRRDPKIHARHVHFDEPHLFDDVDTPADLTRIEETMARV